MRGERDRETEGPRAWVGGLTEGLPGRAGEWGDGLGDAARPSGSLRHEEKGMGGRDGRWVGRAGVDATCEVMFPSGAQHRSEAEPQ